MAEPVRFFFDFSSPFGYLAAQRIDAIGARHGREVVWIPFLLGVVFKKVGTGPLLELPLKGEYSFRDMNRSARLQGVPFKLPEPFPFSSVAASRGFYWAEANDPTRKKEVALALYHRIFGEGGNLATADEVADLLAGLGYDRDTVLAGLGDAAIKDRLRAATEEALEAGVFGSPFFVVDGEPFWGSDRLEQLDIWLERGGW